MRALLDVNILVALLDAQHVHHRTAQSWLAANMADGWATSPLTENGCLRVLTNSRYAAPLPADDVIARLNKAKSLGHHEFWADDVATTDTTVFVWSRLRSHQQVTDVYLLALAVAHAGRLATFDQGLALNLVVGARPEHLVVL
ncbi:MAG: TA system VapC family ribonuclease toxin [Roseimicrobium sp.]